MDALKRNTETEYTLEAGSVWITAGNVSVWIRKSKKQVKVEMYRYCKEMDKPLGRCVATQIIEGE